MTYPIRVGCLTSDYLMQVGLETVIKRYPDLELAFVVADYSCCEVMSASDQPDLLLWLIGSSSTQQISQIHTFCRTQHIPLLILATNFDESIFYTLLKSGVSGYFYTGDDADLLAHAIRSITKGNKWYSPSITAHLLQKRLEYETPTVQSNEQNQLTKREIHILQLVARGWTNQKIGQTLGVTERTVRSHMRNIYDKLDLANRAEAIAWTLNARLP